MFKKILVACDGSDGSNLALHHAAALAKLTGAGLWALWVRHSLPHYPETVDEIAEEEESARDYFLGIKKHVHAVAEQLGIEIHVDSQPGHPAQQIVNYAERGNFDLVVLGHRGHAALWGRLLGHTADRVCDHAPCSVLIARSEDCTPAETQKILVGYDGSARSRHALQQAVALAALTRSEITALWIHERAFSQSMPPREVILDEQWAKGFFSHVIEPEIRTAAGSASVAADYRCGNPGSALVEMAGSGGFGLIVLGYRGHSGLLDRLLGGTADRVSHQAPCDVLIVRGNDTAPH